MDNNQAFLIWSFEHNGWWKPGERGYTTELSEAGHYPYSRALQIVINANQYVHLGEMVNEAMVPVFREVIREDYNL